MASPKKRQYVSAASVFKLRRRDAKRSAKPTAPSNIAANHSPFKPKRAAKSPPKKTPTWNTRLTRGGQRKDPDEHPLVTDFNEATQEYRDYLYKSTAAKINETHDSLVEELRSLSMQPTSDPAIEDDPDAALPLKLSPAELVERETEDMYTPLGAAIVQYREKNKRGEEKVIEATLAERMESFQAFLEKEVDELDFLQQKWEAVVGEIWKCGVQVLGQEKMNELLDLRAVVGTKSESVPTLLIPKHDEGLQPAGDAVKSKKRVLFKNEIPEFLTAPSRLIVPVQPLPGAPEQEVRELEAAIAKIGVKEVAELDKLQKDQHKWWEKKTKQLQTVWENED